MSHPNAPLTPEGRRRLCERVDGGRPICHVAAEAGIARQTLGKWHARWKEEGEAGLLDRASRPSRSPHQTPVEVEDLIEQLRRDRKVGPVQLAAILADEHGLQVASSTISRVLERRGISRLRDLDVSGADLREPVRRYEWAHPGDLIHVDVKKLGNIPDGGGWRFVGRQQGYRNRTATPGLPRNKYRNPLPGKAYVHTVIDDHSRVAYAEVHNDEEHRP